MTRKALTLSVATACVTAATQAYAATDIVLYASDVTNVQGNWTQAQSASGAAGMAMSSSDYGWSTTNTPLASPSDYFEATFTAPAGVSYHVWLRLSAANDSKYNDSVWVQFSDAQAGGSSIYPIGSTNGLAVNLENCFGCGDFGWGWQDKAYWLSQTNVIQFATTGTHTIRVQTREDGVMVDQIVLSPSTYMSAAPGAVTNDSTIVPKPSAASTSSTSSSTSTSPGTASISSGLAYSGTAVSIPGQVNGENFDTGGEGTSYHDTTPGNSGGAYRNTDVDIENSSEGGYDIGWTAPGEWLNYTVDVASAGSYTVELRVASPNGGTLHVGFNTASNVWTSVSVPSTGGWQNWTTVSVPVTLGAGVQQMTILFDTGKVNYRYASVTNASGSSGGGSGGGGSGTLDVATWNIEVDDSSAAHAQTAMDYLAGFSPTPMVIVIQEAHLTQFNTYLSELQNRTGQTWNGVIQTHCPPGAWTGSDCTGSEDEGVAVLTTLPIVGSDKLYLPYADQWHSARAAVRLAVNFNGTTVQVWGMHLQSSAAPRNESMALIKTWLLNYAAPQLLGGDLNADMDQIDISTGLAPSLVDSWQLVGSGSGFTCCTPSPTMKLDYWLSDASLKARPTWTQVNTSPGITSDHYPVQASFTIQP